jgi:predicted GIY-YIG superfamily endonuclease
MPRQAMDFSRTIIYKICCNDLKITDVYVGFTTNFNQRKYAHKRCCKYESQKNYNLKLYQTIRANGGWENG